MSDPSLIDTALAAGASIAGGGGLVGIMVRFLFGQVATRLDKIDKRLEEQDKVSATRHKSIVKRMTHVESRVDAAHHRIDRLDPSTARKKSTKRA